MFKDHIKIMKILKFIPSRSISSAKIVRNRLSEHADQLSKPIPPIKSTVDRSDVEHHSKLSKFWWDLNSNLKPLHALNALRIPFVCDGLANSGADIKNHLPLEGYKILDVGCGGGIATESLARIGAQATGIDASKDLINVASEHAALDPDLSGRLNYVQGTIEKFSTENEEIYDAVVASEIIEHVNDQEYFLKCCAKTIKPGGSLFLTTFNRTLPSWLGGIIAAEYVLRIIPKGTHDWNKFISPNEVQRLLEKCNCKTKLIHGMIYNPWKSEWSWITSTSVNYALHAVKREGRM